MYGHRASIVFCLPTSAAQSAPLAARHSSPARFCAIFVGEKAPLPPPPSHGAAVHGGGVLFFDCAIITGVLGPTTGNSQLLSK